MNINDAANILGLSGCINPKLTREAFLTASKKYHPDINPAGLEMMKIINNAFEVLKYHNGEVNYTRTTKLYPDALNEAINKVINLEGLVIEICGAWLWISGNTYHHKKTLKDAGFRYASKKRQWYFRPEGYKSFGRGKYSMNYIRNKYGTTKPELKMALPA